ncbi:hypothetical protein T4E_158 [Trichinella pseudospiralis]|uniref:Uncharacterized protein n=1 Tax=Trichinella pseudospiralis TaxID=6337 RepID=A0A0V0XCV7_TRIPS|nr:hypothetical protein T4E_158 [Trichinella pseudospiralis]
MSVKHNELRILYLLNSRDELYANPLLTTIETELRCYRSSFEKHKDRRWKPSSRRRRRS